jgi:hypothetical protein
MKKLYFIFLLLPLWGLGGFSYAQSVKLIGSHFDTGAVTFTVDVGAATPTWVLVEYTTDPSPTSAIMSRATFTDVSINPPSAGTLAAEDRGFLLTGSATITAKLSGVSGRFSWCGYAFGTPPKAVLQSDGTYQLRGTPPFIVNGVTLTDDVKTFGPSTCIESFTDFTYNPGGVFPEPPVLTVSASEMIVCPGTEVTFTTSASGGTTSEMTYTWDVAGTTATTTSNTYSQILSFTDEGTYTVRVTNAFCTSKAFTAGSITVFSAGTIATATVYTAVGNAPASPTVHPTSIADCGAAIEYQWRRSGESAATLSDSNTPDYDLSLDNTNYAAAGTYYFNRYAKNKAGDWVAAEGTYTLTVDGAIVPPPYARSTQLWTVVTASGTLVWSDNINDPRCTATTQSSANGCMKTALGALYGSGYTKQQSSTLCPPSWSVPSSSQWNATVCGLFGLQTCNTGVASQANAEIASAFVNVWNGNWYSGSWAERDRAWYWLSNSNYAAAQYTNGTRYCAVARAENRQKAVRCVWLLQ